jgi:dihydrofolate reductase
MRKLIYYVACTVDGFIAREDGSFDCFLTEGEHFDYLFDSFPETVPAHLRGVLGVSAANKHFDAVLMGRRTYEVGLSLGVTSPYPHLRQYLFSRGMKESPAAEVRLVRGGAAAIVRKLKQEPGKDIWLCGGGELAAQLFSEIDELILKVNPVVIGRGVPLFAGAIKPATLEVADRKVFGNGVTVTHYLVVH